MHVKYRQPELPKLIVDEVKFRSDVARIFSSVHNLDSDRLWQIVITATKQRHGTLVVISDKAQAESIRLAKQSTLIEPTVLTPDLVSMVTSIDGAVLISPDGTCFAIGVILDGFATHKGNRARGARYNSAIRYVESQENCLAIVVSEDGGVDLVPDLMPQIKQSDLLHAIEQIREIQGARNPDRRQYYKIKHWLQEHKFYLSQEQCDELNTTMREIEHIFFQESGMLIEHNEFAPHEDMNNSFFLDVD